VDLARAAAWHRQVAALAAAADRAGVATAQLPALLARLQAQQAGLAQAAERARTPLPGLTPTPTEIAAAGANFGDLSDAAIDRALHAANQTLDAADAELTDHRSPPATPSAPGPLATPPAPGPPAPVPPSGPPTPGTAPRTATAPPGWPVRPGPPPAPEPPEGLTRVAGRNGLVYGGFAMSVLIIQVVLFVVADEASTLPMLAPVCLLVLPAFAWLGGWLTIGAAFRAPAGGKVNRTPRLGAVICLMPNALLCAALGVLFAAR
jgi:hypothetical protein